MGDKASGERMKSLLAAAERAQEPRRARLDEDGEKRLRRVCV